MTTLRKKDKALFLIGMFLLVYWILDFINIVFVVQKPVYLLWYSSTGLLLTSLALMMRNAKFISIMFCALFVMEVVWSIDFLSNLLFQKNLFGVTDYLFSSEYTKKDFIMTMYHLFMPPALLIGILYVRKIFRQSWVWALFYALMLMTLTLLIADPSESVNCVHSLRVCKSLFSFIFSKNLFYRIPFALFALTFFIFIPTNKILLKVAEKLNWKVV